jgi:hypothetical protein
LRNWNLGVRVDEKEEQWVREKANRERERRPEKEREALTGSCGRPERKSGAQRSGRRWRVACGGGSLFLSLFVRWWCFCLLWCVWLDYRTKSVICYPIGFHADEIIKHQSLHCWYMCQLAFSPQLCKHDIIGDIR